MQQAKIKTTTTGKRGLPRSTRKEGRLLQTHAHRAPTRKWSSLLSCVSADLLCSAEYLDDDKSSENNYSKTANKTREEITPHTQKGTRNRRRVVVDGGTHTEKRGEEVCLCVCVWGGDASVSNSSTAHTRAPRTRKPPPTKTKQQIATEQRNKRPAAARRENGVRAKPPALLLLLFSSHARSHRSGARGRVVGGVGVVGRHSVDEVPPQTREAHTWRLKSMVVPAVCVWEMEE